MKNIIGIVGFKNSGKTTLIKMIKYHLREYMFSNYEHYEIFKNKQTGLLDNVQVLNFADSLKDQIIALTGCTIQNLESQEFKNSKSKLTKFNEFHKFIYGEYERYTFRELHEIISDDTKQRFGKQVYVNFLFNKYDPSKHLIIGDLRYSKNTPENEEGEIRKRGGIIIKLTRPNLEGDFTHNSESSIKDIEADIEHTNIELEDLFNLAKEIVNKYLK